MMKKVADMGVDYWHYGYLQNTIALYNLGASFTHVQDITGSIWGCIGINQYILYIKL